MSARLIAPLLLLLALVWPLAQGCDAEDPGPAAVGGENNAAPALDADLPDAAEPDAAEADAAAEPDAPQGLDAAPDAAEEPDAAPPRDVGPDTAVEPDAAAEPDAEPDAPEDPYLRILSVEPPSGPLQGGTEIFIGLDGEVVEPVVQIGGRLATQVRQLSPETIIATTPPGVAGAADVKILAGALEDTLVGGFTYYAPLAITSVTPDRSTLDGGTLVEIRGEAFSEGVQVSFGGRSAIALEVIDPQTLRAFTPPYPRAEPVDVRVTRPEDAAVLEGGVTYYAAARLEQVIPAAGPTAGGNLVALTGQGFTPDDVVRFGGLEAAVQSATPSRLEVLVPANLPGPVNVEVLGVNGASGLLGAYRYLEADPTGLEVYAVLPDEGPPGGGQEVVIHGFDLDQDGLEVTFGGVRASLIEINDRALRVRTPPGAPGIVDVEVRAASGAATLPAAYTYLPALSIAGVSPFEGPTSGGTRILVAGEGFTPTSRFFIGPLEVTDLQLESATRARMTTPPGSLGFAPVIVTDGPLSFREEVGFRYTADIAVTGIHPVRGSIAGGTLLTIRGAGFFGPTQVKLGRETCLDPQIIDPATLICTTPPGREGAVDVKVVADGVEYAAPQRYLYYNPASRFGGAWGDEIDGAVNVSVFSAQGSPVEGAFVMLSTERATPYQGFTDANGLITFSGPDVLGEQLVSAAAPLHSSASVQSVDAENITLILFPTVPPQGGGGGGSLPLATITGQVSGFQKIAQPGPDERQIIIVETTRESPGIANPWPGQGNVVDPNGDRTYTLISRVGDVAVIAVGGLINDRTGKFTPYAYGIARYLFVSQDQTYTVNLELEHDLDQVITFKLNGAALDMVNGPNLNRVTPWVDLGFEGVFGGWDFAEGTDSSIAAIHQAPLEGPLADATYTFQGGSYTNGTSPYAIAWLDGVTEVSGLVVLPTLPAVPRPLVPEANGIAPDGYVAFQPSTLNLPDFWQIQLYQLPSTQIWEITIPGNQTWFQLPTFPDFSALPFEDRPNPYGVTTPLYMIITGANISNFDYNQHEYLNDLRSRSRWNAWTRNAWYLTLPAP